MIFGNARLDFTDEIGTDVSCLCVNTATDPRKEGDRRCAKRETGDDRENFAHRCWVRAYRFRKDEKEHPEPKEAETDDPKTHHRTAGESDFETFPEAGASALSGPNIRLGGHSHTDEAGESGAESPDNKGNCDKGRAVHRIFEPSKGEECGDAGDKNGEHFVFCPQERHRSVGDVTPDLLHALGSGILLRNPGGFPEGVGKGENSKERN